MAMLNENDAAELLYLTTDALLVLDRSGRVTYCNLAGQTLVETGAILAINDGVLSARRKTENRLLRAACVEAADWVASAPAPPPVCLRNREGVATLVIDLHRLQTGLIAVRIIDVSSRPPPSPTRLRAILGLTPAEARVAAALLAGHSIAAAAREHGVEAETVRTQVKHIRSKTGSRSQNQLLATLAAVGVAFQRNDPIT